MSGEGSTTDDPSVDMTFMTAFTDEGVANRRPVVDEKKNGRRLVAIVFFLAVFLFLVIGAAIAFPVLYLNDQATGLSRQQPGGGTDNAGIAGTSLTPPPTVDSLKIDSAAPTDDVATFPPSKIPTQKPTKSPTERPTTPSPTTPFPTRLPTVTQTANPTGKPTTSVDESTGFSFYALGDIPYTPSEVPTFRAQIRDLKKSYEDDAAKFVIHLGDMQNSLRVSNCEEKYYTLVRDIFVEESPITTFALAGDNDWNDCPDPVVGWQRFASHFVGIETNWTSHTELGIQRWTDQRPENFVFSIHGVLFLSVNLVNLPRISRNEWNQRTKQNIIWTKQCVENYLKQVGEKGPLRGVVIFAHSLARNAVMPYFAGIRSIFMVDNTKKYRNHLNIPVTYLHGDGHIFKIKSKDQNWDQFNDLMVDNGDAAPPIKVEVSEINEPFFKTENKHQHLIADGLIRVDRRGGLYSR
eukprot:scaffold11660_cov49-Attheya_sp.AAC.6